MSKGMATNERQDAYPECIHYGNFSNSFTISLRRNHN